ncbi:TPA: cob(I)yrinic acid a,c-diamide adenosyltransferase [Candidatus Bathyarchaeota archaeon]|nr:cob(I)yrinic acid a,c-diamide adenosyltransferase [Candidatus Bathyarchaeota archaeon]
MSGTKGPAKPTGLVYVYVGDGEGKTSAAIGHAVRAAGHGKRVAIIHFMKGRETGEYRLLRGLGGITVYLGGPPFFLVTDEDREAHSAKARRAYELAIRLLDGNEYDLLVLDELLYALWFGLLTEEEVLSLIDMRGDAHLIITGRGASARILERSDVVTRMEDVKHHYRHDRKTVPSLDY